MPSTHSDRVAIVGCGEIASAHLDGIRTGAPGAEIHLCDRDRPRAEALAHGHAVAGIHEDFDALLEKVRPDAVHVVTPPPDSHEALAQRALEANAHVLVEKPPVDTAEAWDRLSALADGRGLILAADLSTLGMPVVEEARRRIASGEWGRVVTVHCDFAAAWTATGIPYRDPTHWAYRMHGGVLRNMADHPASLVLDFLDPLEGEPSIRWARRNLLPGDVPDLLHVGVGNADQLGSFTLSLAHGNATRRATFVLEKGTIVIDMTRMLLTGARGQGPPNFVKKALSGAGEGWQLIKGTAGIGMAVARGELRSSPGIVRVVENFHRAIRGQEPLLVRSSTVRAVTAVLERAWDVLAAEARA